MVLQTLVKSKESLHIKWKKKGLILKPSGICDRTITHAMVPVAEWRYKESLSLIKSASMKLCVKGEGNVE